MILGDTDHSCTHEFLFMLLLCNCSTVISMMKQLDELKEMINLMILDSYGLGENSTSTLQSKTLLRIMKYRAPPSKDYTTALPSTLR